MSKPEGIIESYAVTRAFICIKLKILPYGWMCFKHFLGSVRSR